MVAPTVAMRAGVKGQRGPTTDDAAQLGAWQGLLDSLPDTIAVLDRSGFIVAVNRAWTAFSVANGSDPRACSIGSNYLAVCDAGRLDDPIALEVGTALRTLLSGAGDEFTCVYPCHAPDEQRWFSMHVSVLDGTLERHLIVVHHDMTERHRLGSAVSTHAAEARASERHIVGMRQVAQAQAQELFALIADPAVGVVDPQLAPLQIDDAHPDRRRVEGRGQQQVSGAAAAGRGRLGRWRAACGPR